MPLKAKDVVEGVRDWCNLCGEVIILARPDGAISRRHLMWHHLNSMSIFCEGHDKDHNFRAVSRTYCGERIQGGSWYSDVCHRPIKDRDLMMCGVHAAHERKRKQREDEWRENWDLQNYMASELEKIQVRFKEEYGLEVRAEVHYGNGVNYTGKIVVDPLQLIQFLEGLSSEDDEDGDDVEWEEV